jgi:NAD(P)-dependent dehydrogenase (short-subunit alcohol dehydrogenase family)
MNPQNRIIVVSGAGSGIGRQLTLQLLQAGARVAAVDLNQEALSETARLAASDKLSLHALSVADRQAVEALPDQVIAAHGAVDGLINNAGIIQPFLRLNDLPYEAIERVLNVNLYGVIYMLKAFLPHLLQRPQAHVVNISSMGGFFPIPGQSMYGASKAAVKLLSEGLYAELAETNVRVTVVFPGAVTTNITQNSGVTVPQPAPSQAESRLPQTSAEAAARAIIDAMRRDAFQAYVGSDSKLMNLLYRLSPLQATRFIFRQMKALLPD